MMIKMLIKRAAAALRADKMQVRSRADACSSNSFFSPAVHVTPGSAPNNAFSPSPRRLSCQATPMVHKVEGRPIERLERSS